MKENERITNVFEDCVSAKHIAIWYHSDQTFKIPNDCSSSAARSTGAINFTMTIYSLFDRTDPPSVTSSMMTLALTTHPIRIQERSATSGIRRLLLIKSMTSRISAVGAIWKLQFKIKRIVAEAYDDTDETRINRYNHSTLLSADVKFVDHTG